MAMYIGIRLFNIIAIVAKRIAQAADMVMSMITHLMTIVQNLLKIRNSSAIKPELSLFGVNAFDSPAAK